ncbi:MAG: hypothetical protein GF401_11975 [Chitinivibrionales bacterium]|nr:hypothetical protein [Chitinivibrionales bacterium]
MLEDLKPLLNKTLKPIASVMAVLKIHPNMLTITGTLLFGVAGVLIVLEKWKIALIPVIVGSVIDAMDGLVAREFGQKSTFGAVLDSTCDRITEIAWFGGLIIFYVHNPQTSWARWNIYLALIAFSGSVMISYVKARCEGVGIDCSRGILQRPERLILFSLFLLLGQGAMFPGLAILSALAWFTVAQRIHQAIKGGREIDGKKERRKSQAMH